VEGRSISLHADFHPGQQVVCVNEQFSPRPYWRAAVRTFPRLDAVYTIRAICAELGLVGFYFDEIVNPCAWFNGEFAEPAFNSKNFRPVRKTSIALFERLLAPVDAARTRERAQTPA
jgi:hypothetical protein